MASLQVPDRHRDSLVGLLRLKLEEAQQLRVDIDESSGTRAEVAALFGKYVENGRDGLSSVMSLLAILRRYRFVAQTDFILSLATSLRVENADVAGFESILSSETLRRFAKALDLRNEYESIVTDSRIISDIRPIFPDVEPDDGEVSAIPAAIVNHTLRFSVQGDRGDTREVYLAVDIDDLRRLERQIKRALQKEAASRAFIESSGATVLEPKEGD